MPRPDQVLPRAPEGSEHGATAELQRLAAAVPTARRRSPAPSRPIGPEPPLFEQDINDGFDEALFTPTERPDEPITAGVPFGPGALTVRKAFESERAYMLRIADVLETSPVSDAVRAYIEALRAGR